VFSFIIFGFVNFVLCVKLSMDISIHIIHMYMPNLVLEFIFVIDLNYFG